MITSSYSHKLKTPNLIQHNMNHFNLLQKGSKIDNSVKMFWDDGGLVNSDFWIRNLSVVRLYFRIWSHIEIYLVKILQPIFWILFHVKCETCQTDLTKLICFLCQIIKFYKWASFISMPHIFNNFWFKFKLLLGLW